jgi:hypothetical protein
MRSARLPRLLVALSALVLGVACRHDGRPKDDGGSPSPSASALDRTQLAAARRIALESALAAMASRDLQRLKMLKIWVRDRAQVALFDGDDMTSLELAIACLERSSPPEQALARLEGLKTGELRKSARGVCLGGSER